MDGYGRQFDSSVPQGICCGCNISGYSHSCTNADSFSYPGYVLQGLDNNFYQNTTINSNFVGSNQISYAPLYMQQAVTAPEASIPSSSVAPRVHFNPNYRPKLISSGTGSSKPANVHINPHWRGRTDLVSSFGHDKKIESIVTEGVGKKTIFVNPRVLAQMKIKSLSDREGETYQLNSSATCTESKSICGSNYHLLDGHSGSNTHVMSFQNAQTDKQLKTETESAIPDSSSEPSFVVLSSTKLVRRHDIGFEAKPSHQNQIAVNSSRHLLGIPKKAVMPSTSTLKLAKQVCSKYKFVRNSSSVSNSLKIVRSAVATPSRKTRRKSLNLKQPVTTNPRSQYKFVRKSEDCKSATEATFTKQVKKVFSNVSSSSQSVLKMPSSIAGYSTNKNIKSRYKLIRIQAANQKSNASLTESKKLKTVQSRYKLVRASKVFVSNVSRNFSIPGSSVSPLLNNSRLRHVVENISNVRRKVSRFRIIQASATSKLKTKAPQFVVKLCKNRQGTYLGKARVQRPGLYGNMIWQKGKILPPLQLSGDRHFLHLATTPKKQRINVHPASKTTNKSLLNIGGVLYRSTRTTLTRTQSGKLKERVLHIRGKRYVLDANGTILRPAFSPEDTAQQGTEKKEGGALGRIDIGGVTFTRRNDNTLVRTNTHYARTLLSIAKMKSIALLTNKLRKNNQPCLIYHRFGKCNAKEEGKCWRVHDPKNIAICRKFLQGNCEVEKCFLSHAVGPEKMPTCRYYLEGCCVRDNCPYLHVKLSAHAAICRAFLHGYCAAGDMCKKRHVYLCPEYEQDGKCSKGKCCPYPHKNKTKVKARGQKTKYAAKDICRKINQVPKSDNAKEDTPATATNNEADKRMRYYDRNSSVHHGECQTECSKSEKNSDVVIVGPVDYLSEEESEQNNGTAPTRSKLGILPAYIPLD